MLGVAQTAAYLFVVFRFSRAMRLATLQVSAKSSRATRTFTSKSPTRVW